MGKVHVDISMSLDGFVAGPNAGPHNALGDEGDRLHEWLYNVELWHEYRSGEGGQTAQDAFGQGQDAFLDDEVSMQRFRRTAG